MSSEQTVGQQHPIGLYLKVWLLLFVLSFFSYLVDYFQLEGLLRWSLIVLFMLLKAGLIVSIFMHFAWERFALKFVVLVPLFAIFVFIGIMAIESGYIYHLRVDSLSFNWADWKR